MGSARTSTKASASWRFWWGAAICSALAIAVLSACGEPEALGEDESIQADEVLVDGSSSGVGDGPSSAGPAPEQQVEDESVQAAQVLLDGSRGNVAGSTDAQAEEQVEKAHSAYVDRVAACMRSAGFEFVAFPEGPESPANDSPYGITARVMTEPATDPFEDAPAEISPEQQQPYLVALWGDPTDASANGCAAASDESVNSPPSEQPETDLFADGQVIELQGKAESMALARDDVRQTIADAEQCVLDRLGDVAAEDPFGFSVLAERLVAQVVDPAAASNGATVADMVDGSDDPPLFDDVMIAEMLEVETLVWTAEQECRLAIQDDLDAAFVEEAARLLADSPDLVQALVEARRMARS